MTDQDPRILDSKILIIDDEVTVGMTLEETLKEQGYMRVRSISDPVQSETVYQEFEPDLIILDIKMPRMDGFQVMEILKTHQNGAFVPIIVLTAVAEEEICLRALSSGASDFLNKPMQISEALVRIQNMLRVRVLQKELQHQKDFLEEKVEDRTAQLKKTIKELDRMNQEVKDAYIETIYRLTRATEYKDEETAHHVKRLSLYAAALGKAVGLSEPLIDLLLYASPMHDIGKIGIPDKILFKGTKLDEEEWQVMRTHPTIGYEILEGSTAPVLKLGASIALSHHERWDGSGYPNGLKGEQIPIEGRILALVDVYDALRSKRHYKEPFTHEKACEIILEGDGRVKPDHFDPALLEAFKGMHLDFKKIYDDNAS